MKEGEARELDLRLKRKRTRRIEKTELMFETKIRLEYPELS